MEKAKKNSDLNALKWIIEILDKDIKYVYYLVIVRCAMGVEGTVFALVLKRVTNCATSHNREGLIHNLIVIGLIVIIAIICYVLSIYIKEKANAIIERRFRRTIMSSLLNKEYSFITSKYVGEWTARLLSDSNSIYHVVLEIFPSFIGTIVQFICASGALLFTNLSISAAFLVGGALLVVFSFVLRKKLKEYQRFVVIKDASYRSMVTEKLSGMIIIKSYNMEDNTIGLLDKKLDDLVKAKMKRTSFTTLCSSCMYGAMRIAYLAGVCLFGYLILKNRMEYGDMIANLQIITLVVTPISNISSYIPQFFTATTSAERIMEIDEAKDDYQEEIYDLTYINAFYNNHLVSLGIENGTFSYSDVKNEYESSVVDNLSVEIQKGDIVAITGKSGCGKSTLLKLLMSLYHLKSGQAYYLDELGQKIDITSKWRNMYAYVPQGNYLESGKIRDVITFFDENKRNDDEALWSALHTACADFIKEMPNGLDYELLERGAGLSEGQIQRLAIARALLSNRPILMLDECTSSLDEQTEATLLENIRKMTNCTVILITHRPKALEIVNKRIEL